jgi:hypothetical protein
VGTGVIWRPATRARSDHCSCSAPCGGVWSRVQFIGSTDNLRAGAPNAPCPWTSTPARRMPARLTIRPSTAKQRISTHSLKPAPTDKREKYLRACDTTQSVLQVATYYYNAITSGRRKLGPFSTIRSALLPWNIHRSRREEPTVPSPSRHYPPPQLCIPPCHYNSNIIFRFE